MKKEKPARSGIKPTYRGSLEKNPPARVINRMHLAGESGFLDLSNHDDTITLQLLNGELLDIFSDNEDRFNFNKYIEKSRPAPVPSEQKTHMDGELEGNSFEKAFARGYMDIGKLSVALREYFVLSLTEILPLNTGIYTFSRCKPEGTRYPPGISSSLPQLIIESARNIDLNNISGQVSSTAGMKITIDDSCLKTGNMCFNSKELRIFKLCGMSSTVGEVLNSLKPEGEKETASILDFITILKDMEILKLTMQHGPDARTENEKSTHEKPTTDSAAIEMSLEADLEKFSLIDPFELLKVREDSSDEDVKTAFLELAKKYHPDTTPTGASEKCKGLKNRIFAIISSAFSELSTAERRKKAAEKKAEMKDGEFQPMGNMESILEAEQKFIQAKALCNRGKSLDEAFRLCEEALKSNPREYQYRIYYNWLLWQTSGADNPEVTAGVRMELIKILKEHPSAEGFVFLGKIFKSSGDIEKSESAFEKAMKLDPKNLAASLELQLIQKRRRGGTRPPLRK